MLEGIEVKLNTNFFDNKNYYLRNCKKLVYTGMIDDKNNNLIDKYLELANKQKIYYDMDDVKKNLNKANTCMLQ